MSVRIKFLTKLQFSFRIYLTFSFLIFEIIQNERVFLQMW